MNVTLGLIIFVLVVGGFAAVRKMRAHIARLTAVIDRQEADLLTCVEAQRHTSQVLGTYSEAFGQLADKLEPQVAAALHALTIRLARQGSTLAQTLSHWDGRSDPRALLYPAELDADIEELVRALEDSALNQLWQTRRPGDVAQMVEHLISLSVGAPSKVEAQLRHAGWLERELSVEAIVAAWQRPASTPKDSTYA